MGAGGAFPSLGEEMEAGAEAEVGAEVVEGEMEAGAVAGVGAEEAPRHVLYHSVAATSCMLW